jgi:hypothetical protein
MVRVTTDKGHSSFKEQARPTLKNLERFSFSINAIPMLIKKAHGS